MNKRFGAIGLAPLLILGVVLFLTIFLVGRQTGFFNRASSLNENDYSISFDSNKIETETNYASVSGLLQNPSLVLDFPYTIEGWFKTPKPTTGNYIHVYTPLALQSVQTIVDSGFHYKLTFETQDSDGSTRPMFTALLNNPQPNNMYNTNYLSIGGNNTTSLPANEWHHVAVVATSSGNFCTAAMYLDGALSDSREMYKQNCSTWKGNPLTLTFAKPIANEGGISGYYYPGEMNEVRISNVRRYVDNFVPTKTPFALDENTVGLWHFDQNTLDSSNHGNSATVTGTVNYVSLDQLTTHKECVNNACVVVNGVGQDRCTTNEFCNPTASYLGKFAARVKNVNEIVLSWNTVNELKVLGFNAYRSTKKADGSFTTFAKINTSPISSSNTGQITGADYKFSDKKVQAGKTYRYKLELIGVDNKTLAWSQIVRVSTSK